MKDPRRNQFISTMSEFTGEPDPFRAVAKYANQFRQPGMTLESLARTLGVSAIVREKLSFDGGVFSDGKEMIIKINSESIPARRRFTLAHEIAHLIISTGSVKSARRCLKFNPLEDACDFVASELLMPIGEAQQSIERPASMNALLSFAQQFNVSLQAAAVRIKQLGAWRESVGLWKWKDRPQRLWYVGERFWQDDQLPCEPFSRAMKESCAVKARELFRDYRGTREVSLKVQRLGQGHILGLLRG